MDNEIDDGTTPVTWTYTHDDNGNMVSRQAGPRSKTDGTDTFDYTWDDQNRLIEVEFNSVSVVTYEYDSASRMIQRVEGGTTTNYTWDGWDLIREEKTGIVTDIVPFTGRLPTISFPSGKSSPSSVEASGTTCTAMP